MKKSVIEFHSNLIDYAGLFPPAKQNMHDAWRDFCAYKDSDHSWMLSNFICPASRLDELNKYFSNSTFNDRAFPLSILGSRSDNVETIKSKLNADIDLVRQFISSNINDTIEINIFETHFPTSVFSLGKQVEVLELLDIAEQSISDILNDQGMIFYELPVIGADMNQIISFIKAISIYNDSRRGAYSEGVRNRCGYKLRCGGVTADSFPSVSAVADIVITCQERGVPLKATAGLHHPLRHFSKDVNNEMHGFLNLIGAVILADSNKLELNQIKQILSDENSNSFMFSDESFCWQELNCKHDQISNARQQSFVSYGSCSFVEPIDDLKALGIF